LVSKKFHNTEDPIQEIPIKFHTYIKYYFVLLYLISFIQDTLQINISTSISTTSTNINHNEKSTRLARWIDRFYFKMAIRSSENSDIIISRSIIFRSKSWRSLSIGLGIFSLNPKLLQYVEENLTTNDVMKNFKKLT